MQTLAVRVQHELPGGAASNQVFVCAANVAQWVDLAQLRRDLTARRPLEQVAQRFAHHRLGALEAVHQPKADHSAALAHESPRSQVVLLGDPNCKVAALVENETRDKGVIGASDPLDNSLIVLGYLSKSANLKAGQSVSTSGLGGIFPSGIPIGKVVDARPVEYGLYVEARVKLATSLSGLEEVWVLFP